MGITAGELNILIRARDEATRVLGNVKTSFVDVAASAAKAGAALTALSVPAAMVAKQALDATAYYERLGLSLKNMAAAEAIAAGQAKTVAEAIALVSDKAAGLMTWIEQLAIKSPFEQEDVANAFQTAMTFGYTTEQAKRLTAATLDMMAATGRSAESLWRVNLALGQMRSLGRIAGNDVLQLAQVGISVDRILAEAFGKTTNEIVEMRTAGLIPADQAVEAIISHIEKMYGGAGAAQSSTLTGLVASLQDIKKIGLKDLFAGVFDAVKPALQSLVDTLTSDEFRAALKGIGKNIGEAMSGAVPIITKLVGKITELAQWLAHLNPNILKAALAFGAVVATAGPVLLAIAGIAALLGSLAGPIGIIIVAVGALAAAMSTNFLGIRDVVRTVVETVGGFLVGLKNMVVGEALGMKEDLQSAWQLIVNTARAVWPYLQEIVGAAWNSIKMIIATGVQSLLGILRAFSQIIQGDWAGTWETIKGVLAAKWEAIKYLFANGINALYNAVGEGITGVIEQAVNGIVGFLNQMLEKVESAVNWAINMLNKLPGVNLEPVNWQPIDPVAVAEWTEKALLEINSFVSEVNTKLEFTALDLSSFLEVNPDVFSDLDELSNEMKDLKGLGKESGASFATGISTGVQTGLDAAKKALETFKSTIEGFLSKGMNFSVGLADLTTDIFKPGANGPFENLYRAQDIAVHGESSPWAAVLGLTQEDAKRIVTDFQNGLFTDGVKGLIDMPALIDAAQMAAMADASKTAFVNEIAKIAGVSPTAVQALLGTSDTSTTGQIITDVTALAGDIKTAFDGQVAEMVKAGEALIKGVIDGMNNTKQDLIDAAEDIAKAAAGAAANALKPGTPTGNPPAYAGGESEYGTRRGGGYTINVTINGGGIGVKESAQQGVLAALRSVGVA